MKKGAFWGEYYVTKILTTNRKSQVDEFIGFSFCLLIGAIVVYTSIERKNSFLHTEEVKLIGKYKGIQRGFDDRAELATSLLW